MTIPMSDISLDDIKRIEQVFDEINNHRYIRIYFKDERVIDSLVI